MKSDNNGLIVFLQNIEYKTVELIRCDLEAE